jgi:uncharacterized protein
VTNAVSTDRAAFSWPAVLFGLAFPSLVTVTYFVWLAGQPRVLQHGAYVIGKTVQFVFPAAWVFWITRRPRPWAWPRRRGLGVAPAFRVLPRCGSGRRPNLQRGLGLGTAFGLLVFAVMLVLYHGLLKPQGVFEGGPAEAIQAKVRGFGVAGVWQFVTLGAFYAIGHSLLEEYYWRWFVFGQLRLACRAGTAIAVSSLGFMAHHVILMAVYFGWSSPWTYGFSLAVAIGGVFWAWLYERSGSLLGPWISHLLIDAAIFTVGYDLVRGV